jgi:hypothetical protein
MPSVRLLAILVPLLSIAAGAATPVETYLDTRDRFVAAINKAPDAPGADRQDKAARAELEGLIRHLVGPVRLEGFPPEGASNLDTLIQQVGFGKLDGLVFAREKPVIRVVVTTLALLKRWLEDHKTDEAGGAVPGDLKQALASEPFYTFAISPDAAIAKYADLPIAAPRGASLAVALLVLQRQDVTPDMPDEIVVSAIRDGRVFVMSERLAKPIKPIPACAAIWRDYQARADKTFAAYQASRASDTKLFDAYVALQNEGDVAHRQCYGQRIRDDPAFAALVRQAQALADLAR